MKLLGLFKHEIRKNKCFFAAERERASPYYGLMYNGTDIERRFAVNEGEISMLVSTKGRYALRMLIDLAEHQSGDYVPLRAIAERQQISEKYLEPSSSRWCATKFSPACAAKAAATSWPLRRKR